MSITLLGPDWPTITELRRMLTSAPENGTYRLGGRPTNAIDQLTTFRSIGLLTPDFTTYRQIAMDWVNEGHMVFGRRLIHTRGNDIVISPKSSWLLAESCYSGPITRTRWWNSEWWSKYLPPTEEWRVHVFDGRSIARGIKIHSGNSWRKARVRNIGNGWSFDFTRDSPRGLRTIAKAAVQALGYPVGAVDILQVDRIDPTAPEGLQREFYVLEVNRIPALTCPYTRTAWVEAIRRHVRKDFQPNENIE